MFDIEAIQQLLEYEFSNPQLLEEAMCAAGAEQLKLQMQKLSTMQKTMSIVFDTFHANSMYGSSGAQTGGHTDTG